MSNGGGLLVTKTCCSL